VDADITAISRQGLTNFYPTIHHSNCFQINNLQRLIDRVQSLEAQLSTVTTARQDALAEVETWCGRFNMFCQMTAHLGAGGNGGGGVSLSKSQREQHQPPVFTGDYCYQRFWTVASGLGPGSNQTSTKLVVHVVNKREPSIQVWFNRNLPTHQNWAGTQRVVQRVHL